MKLVLDTNIALYLLGGRLEEPLSEGSYHVSVITELELLCYPALRPEEEARIRSFLADVSTVDLDEDVKKHAVVLRRLHGLKLPDAIIAATALSLDAQLLTNDQRMVRVPEIRTRSLQLKETSG